MLGHWGGCSLELLLLTLSLVVAKWFFLADAMVLELRYLCFSLFLSFGNNAQEYNPTIITFIFVP